MKSDRIIEKTKLPSIITLPKDTPFTFVMIQPKLVAMIAVHVYVTKHVLENSTLGGCLKIKISLQFKVNTNTHTD